MSLEIEYGYDKMSMAHDTRENIELSKDKLNSYELAIATDTGELLYKNVRD